MRSLLFDVQPELAMFKCKKPDKRGRERLRALREAFMTVDEDEPVTYDSTSASHPVPEVVAEAPQATDEQRGSGDECGAEECDEYACDFDQGDWREGDADFFDVEMAGGEIADLDPASETTTLELPANHRRWPAARDANDISVFMAGLQAKRDVPIAVFYDLMKYFDENKSVVAAALSAGELSNFRTMRARAARSVPAVLMDVHFTDDCGRSVSYQGVKSYPQQEAAARNLRRQYVLFYVSLNAVISFHHDLHADEQPDYFDLSVDGIPESKSGGRSIDVLSIRFQGCKGIYSLAILQPDHRGMGLADDIVLRHVLDEYDPAVVPLRFVIADAPKRAALSGLKQHSSNFACQYCQAEKVDRAYPWTTHGAPLRTNEETRAIADSGRDYRGVKKPSPLRSITTLDIINHIPAEKMHLCDLGVVRKIIQLSFKCPQFKAQQVPFHRADDSALSRFLEAAKSLPDFSRRTRALDAANYKAEEYRNLAVGYWPLVAKTIPRAAREVWLLTVFAYRACLLPDRRYTAWKEIYDEEELFRLWYQEFDSAFGTHNCSYNPHTFHHLPIVRKLAPLSATSAYGFENHYNSLKRSYRPGTASIGQQALSGLLVAGRHGHRCGRSRRVSGQETTKVDDTWCFIPDVGIIKVSETDGMRIRGRRVRTEDRNELLTGLNFCDVWAFKLSEPITFAAAETYQIDDVAGKCVLVDGVASVFPWDLLEE